MERQWYVYVVRCGDGSLYTGITKNIARRVAEHDEGRGARYTRGRGPIALVRHAGPFTRTDALRLECRVKRLRGASKLMALEEDAHRVGSAP